MEIPNYKADYTIVYSKHDYDTHLKGFLKARELRAQGYRVSLGSRSGNISKQVRKATGDVVKV